MKKSKDLLRTFSLGSLIFYSCGKGQGSINDVDGVVFTESLRESSDKNSTDIKVSLEEKGISKLPSQADNGPWKSAIEILSGCKDEIVGTDEIIVDSENIQEAVS